MRGKGYQSVLCAKLSKITPAYAGKRWIFRRRQNTRWDHPCVCGEKTVSAPHSSDLTGSPLRMRGKYNDNVLKTSTKGSPLRMRGKVCDRILVHLVFRITPAYAGKSIGCVRMPSALRDHPCVCGEKFSTDFGRLLLLGSPLRMRGKADISSVALTPLRITPAYAGKRVHGT